MEQFNYENTIVRQTRRILPADCNGYGFLFGGHLTAWLDELTSISASKFCRQKVVTASIDDLYFIQSINLDDIIYLESYVTGSGNRSIEVFAKVVGENILTGEQYLAAISFWTFVVVDENAQLKRKKISTSDHIVDNYAERLLQVRKKRQDRQTLIKAIEQTLNKGQYND